MALSRRRTFANRGGATSARIQSAVDRRAGLEQAARQRTQRLAGAVGQFLNPQLSGQQNQFIHGLGATAGLQGLFGGAVEGAGISARTQFLAGNRLSGLEGIAEFGSSGFLDRPVSAQGGGLTGTLAQILGLETQFRLGGAAGRETINQLDPAGLGAFIGRRAGTRFARRGLLGQRTQASILGTDRQTETDPSFGGTAALMPEGLQGLRAAGLLPFLVQGEQGTQTLPGLLRNNPEFAGNTAEELFSPALFR